METPIESPVASPQRTDRRGGLFPVHRPFIPHPDPTKMLPSALLCEHTKTVKSASHTNNEGTGTEDKAASGDELAPNNVLVDEFAHRVVYLEDGNHASDYAVDLPVPQAEHHATELHSFEEAYEDPFHHARFKGQGKERDGEGVLGSNAPDDGVAVLQEPGGSCVQTSRISIKRGASTADPTMHEFHNSSKPLSSEGPETDLSGGLWTKDLNCSHSQVDGGFRPRKKRRLGRVERLVWRMRILRRATWNDEEDDSGCEADTESSLEDEDDHDDHKEEMAALGLMYLARVGTC